MTNTFGKRNRQRGILPFWQMLFIVGLLGLVAGGTMLAVKDQTVKTAKGGDETMNASTLGTRKGLAAGAGSDRQSLGTSEVVITSAQPNPNSSGSVEPSSGSLQEEDFDIGNIIEPIEPAETDVVASGDIGDSEGAELGEPEEPGFWRALGNVAVGYISFSPRSPGEVKAYASSAGSTIYEGGKATIQGAWSVLKFAGRGVKGGFKYTFGIGDTRETVHRAVGKGWDATVDAVVNYEDTYASAKKFVGDVASSVNDAVQDANRIVENGSDVEKAELYGKISGGVVLVAAEVAVGVATGGAATAASGAAKAGRLGTTVARVANRGGDVVEAAGDVKRLPPPPEVKLLPAPDAVRRNVTDVELDDLYAMAPAAKKQIDDLADEVAAANGGSVAKAPLKKRDRTQEKIDDEYGGDPAKIKDIARNTVIVHRDQIGDVAGQLGERGANVKNIVRKTDTTPGDGNLGYTGVNTTVKTNNGMVAEVQVNSPEMIFAKEKPGDARAILKDDDLYDEIQAKAGVEGGRGHVIYEEYRKLDADDPATLQRRTELELESQEYYDTVREKAGGSRLPRLQDDPDLYFKSPEGTKLVDMGDLDTTRARPKGIANAEVHMRNAALGQGERRKPITVFKKDNGRYEVLDGNSTTNVAMDNGWQKLPVTEVSAGEAATIRAAELAKATAKREQLEKLGDGSFSVGYRDGDQVVKVLKDEMSFDDATYRLSTVQKSQLANHTADFQNELAQDVFQKDGFVPELTVSGPGEMRLDLATGKEITDLPNFAAQDAARANMESAVGRANRHYDLDLNGTGELEDGFRVMVDPNPANFRFDDAGNVTSWFDPVAVFPPKSAAVGSGIVPATPPGP